MTDKLTTAALEAEIKRLEQELADARIAFDAERSELQSKLDKALYDAEQAWANVEVPGPAPLKTSDGLQ